MEGVIRMIDGQDSVAAAEREGVKPRSFIEDNLLVEKSIGA
jgi:hypothetical protein